MTATDSGMARPQRIAASVHGMVATAHDDATQAAAEVLEDGGNAMDAAVAAALALGVCEPQACGLGGQTMMLSFDAETRRTVALDGSSRVPTRATIDDYHDKLTRLRGHRAATVPSTPAVLAYAAKTQGTLPWARLLEPAIRLAEEGYVQSELGHRLQRREQEHWADGNAGSVFLQDGQPWPVGEVLRQPALANTLRRLADTGVEDFYVGEIAELIEQDMVAHDGFIRRDDLALIPWPVERRPIACRFEGLRVHTFPPPGAGRTLVEMLNILGHLPEKLRNPDTPLGALTLSELIRRAQLDRRDRPFDPNIYPQIEERRMISAEYAKLAARQIRARVEPRPSRKRRAERRSRPEGALGSEAGRETEERASAPGAPPSSLGAETGSGGQPDAGEAHGDTTHLSVMDRHGNVVGLTQSIERVYGSFVLSPQLGFLYNNYLSAFVYKDYTNPYFLRPNGIPWASVAPTIVFRGRRPWLVIGSPGSDRITAAILQVLLRLLRHQSPLEAVAAPRMFCSAAGRVSLEASWMRDDIPERLEKHGFRIDRREPFSFYLGCVQAVVRDGKTLVGVADPRRDGSARGARR